MQGRIFAVLLVLMVAGGAVATLMYFQKTNQMTDVLGTPSPGETEEVVSDDTKSEGESQMETNMEPDFSVDANGLSKATVVVDTTKGTIKFKFYSEDAPNTSRRIAELINSGFYNGLTFHRVVPGFVIQGGDPVGNGTGGSGTNLKAEFNSRKHVEGTVAMARAQDPDSADSQFYISLGTHPHLDKSYTVFGMVIEGMDVVRRIQIGDRMTSVVIR